MRVLIAHNRYRYAGGEERAVAEHARVLGDAGHDVALLERDSATVTAGRAGIALLTGGDRRSVIALGDAARRHRAEVVHVHNMLPLLGPRSLRAARETGARVVLHLHNHRLFCAIGVAFRDGAPCHECSGTNTWPGLRHRCRGSAAEGIAYAAGLAAHQATVLRSVDRFVVPSAAGVDQLVRHGLPRERATVVPNALPGEAFASSSAADHGGYALYAGRLVEEKGVETVIAAAKAAGVPLKIAGAGPDEPRFRAHAASADGIEFLGHLDAAAVAELRAGAAFAVVPSRSEEMGPYAVLEALAAGLPVLGSDLGALPELIGDRSLLVAPGDEGAWATAMRRLWDDPTARREHGEAGLAAARERFSGTRLHDRLMEVYAG